MAFIPNGMVTIRKNISIGNFDKSIFKNKSDLPIAFKAFMLIADNGVSILAKHKICNRATHGSQITVSRSSIDGLARIASKVLNVNDMREVNK